MAKFSQEFLRQMATPAFGQGMFTAAKQAAQLPAQLRQQQQMQQQRQQLAQIDTNSPEGLLRLAQFYRQQGDVANAVKYEEAARKLQEQGAAQAQLSAFQEQVAVGSSSSRSSRTYGASSDSTSHY
jgi:cytochrome c-type biogenesis protein CcmH/NrfG